MRPLQHKTGIVPMDMRTGNESIQQARNDKARLIVANQFENWSHKELVDNILDQMTPKEILEFADELTDN